LAHLPTPLEPLERLGDFLGGPRLYVKRDDCTGLAMGGNKTRKLEFLLGEAREQGATAVVTEGGRQSNHVRQTAAAAAKAGLACHLALDNAVPPPDRSFEVSGNIFLDRLLGARISFCEPGQSRRELASRIVEELRGQGETPYFIPTGGSSGVGALGYAGCALEIVDQAHHQDLAIDRIVVASGSGGTLAGLLVGFAMADSGAIVLGIDIDDEPERVADDTAEIARDCAALVGLDGPDRDQVVVVEGYAAPGYGLPNPAMIEAVRLVARLEGILLDPVYSGKAMAALIDMVRREVIGADETIVFVHSGGMPALFAYTSAFEGEDGERDAG
jgi:D-cysteine desulfhydrase family pyridoxal phosphate-dependent enzyme